MSVTSFINSLIVAMILCILFSLGAGLYYLFDAQGKTTRMVRALFIRIGLSLTLFIGLWVAFAMGWITPHSQRGL